MNRAVVLIAICSAMVGVSYGMHSPIVPVFAREQLAARLFTSRSNRQSELSSLYVRSLLRRHLAG
jgi:hypothetical protein